MSRPTCALLAVTLLSNGITHKSHVKGDIKVNVLRSRLGSAALELTQLNPAAFLRQENCVHAKQDTESRRDRGELRHNRNKGAKNRDFTAVTEIKMRSSRKRHT
jgi:hypothetical protein